MAVIKNNPMMSTASGKLGPVYFRTVRGKLIMCSLPAKGRKFTEKQKAAQKRFGEQSQATKHLLKDPIKKAEYQARIDNNKFTAHMVALSDMMQPVPDKVEDEMPGVKKVAQNDKPDERVVGEKHQQRQQRGDGEQLNTFDGGWGPLFDS